METIMRPSDLRSELDALKALRRRSMNTPNSGGADPDLPDLPSSPAASSAGTTAYDSLFSTGATSKPESPPGSLVDRYLYDGRSSPPSPSFDMLRTFDETTAPTWLSEPNYAAGTFATSSSKRSPTSPTSPLGRHMDLPKHLPENRDIPSETLPATLDTAPVSHNDSIWVPASVHPEIAPREFEDYMLSQDSRSILSNASVSSRPRSRSFPRSSSYTDNIDDEGNGRDFLQDQTDKVSQFRDRRRSVRLQRRQSRLSRQVDPEETGESSTRAQSRDWLAARGEHLARLPTEAPGPERSHELFDRGPGTVERGQSAREQGLHRRGSLKRSTSLKALSQDAADGPDRIRPTDAGTEDGLHRGSLGPQASGQSLRRAARTKNRKASNEPESRADLAVLRRDQDQTVLTPHDESAHNIAQESPLLADDVFDDSRSQSPLLQNAPATTEKADASPLARRGPSALQSVSPSLTKRLVGIQLRDEPTNMGTQHGTHDTVAEKDHTEFLDPTSRTLPEEDMLHNEDETAEPDDNKLLSVSPIHIESLPPVDDDTKSEAVMKDKRPRWNRLFSRSEERTKDKPASPSTKVLSKVVRRKESNRDSSGSFLGSIFSRRKSEDANRSSPSSGNTTEPKKKKAELHSLPKLIFHRYRLPLHIERAVYRLSHVKLANPKRPLHEQVLISNLMFWYLSIINSQQPEEQEMAVQQHLPNQASMEDDLRGNDDSEASQDNGLPDHSAKPTRNKSAETTSVAPPNPSQPLQGNGSKVLSKLKIVTRTSSSNGGVKKVGLTPKNESDPRRQQALRSAMLTVRPPQYDQQQRRIDQDMKMIPIAQSQAGLQLSSQSNAHSSDQHPYPSSHHELDSFYPDKEDATITSEDPYDHRGITAQVTVGVDRPSDFYGNGQELASESSFYPYFTSSGNMQPVSDLSAP